MTGDTIIDTFIERLSNQTFPDDDVFNEYAPDDPNNAIRRENLRRYLKVMQARKPSTMLVMEAPGYRGCRLTGVPVTSRKILLEGLPELDLFGTHRGYEPTADAGFENVHGEQSATIVWSTLVELDAVPLIWNTFPFHPRKSGKPRTNRRPRVPETQLGLTFLETLIDHFKPRQIVAVGNVAHDTLTRAGIECYKVRHPAQGGKHDFVAGLTQLMTG